MTDLYENLLKATNNIDDITTEKYGVITKLDGLYCSVKETDNELEHNNVPIVNGANLSVGDKVIIGFLNNSIYDVVCYGALDKTIHDDSKQDTLISGTNIKTINHQSLLGSGNITIEGGGGGGGDVPIVANWTLNPSDTRVPSEKLTKNTLDTKSDVGHTHDDRYYTETEIDSALLIKQDLLVSGTNIKTINNESILGSGNITIQGGGGSGGSYINDYYWDDESQDIILDYDTGVSEADIVTTWSSPLRDDRVPSEKLVKETIDNSGGGSSVDIVTTWEQILSDNKVASEKLVKNTIDALSIPSKTSDLVNDSGFTTFDGDYDSLTNKPTIPTIPTNVSAFTNDVGYLTQHQSLSNYVQKSSTTGLLRNDGTVDTTSYATSSQISSMLTDSDIVDNLTTSDATKVLSAKQGKELKDLIGSAISYINQ